MTAPTAELLLTSGGYAGADWLERQFQYVPGQRALSPLGRTVADLLGEVFRGLYHLENSALFAKRTKWDHEKCITVTIGRELANHDSPELTWLVLLSHAYGVRLAIKAAAPRYLRLQFTTGEGTMYFGGVPDVATIVERFNERFPGGAK